MSRQEPSTNEISAIFAKGDHYKKFSVSSAQDQIAWLKLWPGRVRDLAREKGLQNGILHSTLAQARHGASLLDI